ncbi:hypothetical protein [Intrasporangium mesophilum]
MARGGRRRLRTDVPLTIGAVVLFVGYVWLLTRATEPIVSVFAFASDNRPKLYAALLAVLVGLPGILLTLPRALTPPRQTVVSSIPSRREAATLQRSYVKTDVLALAVLLLAQAPLPAPWGPAGKAATIANVTKSPEIVELSATFATYSLGVFAVGILAAVLAKVYVHAAAYRVLAIILVIGAPVVAWVLAIHSIS